MLCGRNAVPHAAPLTAAHYFVLRTRSCAACGPRTVAMPDTGRRLRRLQLGVRMCGIIGIYKSEARLPLGALQHDCRTCLPWVAVCRASTAWLGLCSAKTPSFGCISRCLGAPARAGAVRARAAAAPCRAP